MRLAQAAVALGVLAWRRPQALAPANVAAVATAPMRRATAYVGQLAAPAGAELGADEARALVRDWQRAKAAATGAPGACSPPQPLAPILVSSHICSCSVGAKDMQLALPVNAPGLALVGVHAATDLDRLCAELGHESGHAVAKMQSQPFTGPARSLKQTPLRARAGASHDVAALDAVLSGRMLKEWRQRAQELREDGWCAGGPPGAPSCPAQPQQPGRPVPCLRVSPPSEPAPARA